MIQDVPPLSVRSAKGIRAALLAVMASTLLAIVKIVSGVVGHSYALIADGIESMLDIISSLVVIGGLRIAARPADENHPYGHGKAESMSAMVVALCLLAAALGLAVQCVREILTPHHAPAPFTLVVLVLVVAVKELLYARLSRVGRALESTSVRVDAWHHRSDALTSTAAFVGISIALLGGEGYESADDWAALFACGIIAFNGARMMRTAASEVMDQAAPPEVEQRIRRTASGVAGVIDVDKCLARKSGPAWLVDIHVEVDARLTVAEGHAIAHRVKDALLAENLGILDVLVHIEPAPHPDLDGSPDPDSA